MNTEFLTLQSDNCFFSHDQVIAKRLFLSINQTSGKTTIDEPRYVGWQNV